MFTGSNQTKPFFSPPKDEYLDFKKKLDYSINLIWFNACKKEDQEFIFDKDMVNYISNQLLKWCQANPNNTINLWYDSETTTTPALNATRQLFKRLSTQIQLKDIREIPSVSANADFFQAALPPYNRIDMGKLFISLYEMVNIGRTAVIVTDFSIGDKVDKVLGERELFSKDIVYRLKKLGMLVGNDSLKPENQFLQFCNEPNLIESLKHTLNSTLLIESNTLNLAIKEKNGNLINCINDTPFVATMIRIYIYLQILQAKEKPMIRADIVDEGSATEWVPYEAIKHQYKLFGNFQLAYGGSVYLPEIKIDSQMILLKDIVKLPTAINLPIYAKGTDYWDDLLLTEAVRSDLNPGHWGKSHSTTEVKEWPIPKNGETFVPTYFPLEGDNLEQVTYLPKHTIS